MMTESACARTRARATISGAQTPVIRSTRSGQYPATSAATWANPFVRAST
jgi:hypothetical protein